MLEFVRDRAQCREDTPLQRPLSRRRLWVLTAVGICAVRRVCLSQMCVARPESTTSFHRIFSFADTANNYLKTLKKGALVYVEASFELRDAVTEAGQPPASKQVFCRHGALTQTNLVYWNSRLAETLRLLKHAMHKGDSEEVSGQP